MSPIKFILQPKKTAVHKNNNKNKSGQAGRSTLGKIHNGNNLVNMEAEPSARRGHAAFSSPLKLTREINIKAADDDRQREKKKKTPAGEKEDQVQVFFTSCCLFKFLHITFLSGLFCEGVADSNP